MYPYRTVERVLTKLHGNTEAAAARVSARVKHFNRLGLTPASPGKGKKIIYTFDDLAKWHYSLELLEFGIDPTALITIIYKTWDRVLMHIHWDHTGRNYLLNISPRVIAYPDTWLDFFWEIKDPAENNIEWSQVRRRMVINLSGLTADLRTALAEVEAEDSGAKVDSVFVVPPGV